MSVLYDSDYQTVRKYWSVLKVRLKEEGFKSVTSSHQLKLEAAGGKNMLDVGNAETIPGMIQSNHSKKLEKR